MNNRIIQEIKIRLKELNILSNIKQKELNILKLDLHHVFLFFFILKYISNHVQPIYKKDKK